MKTIKSNVSSQLHLYRMRNVGINGSYNEESTKKAICNLISEITECAKGVFLSPRRSFKRGIRLENRVRDDLARNTTPNEMDAKMFDLDRALQAFRILKTTTKQPHNDHQKARFSTYIPRNYDTSKQPSTSPGHRHEFMMYPESLQRESCHWRHFNTRSFTGSVNEGRTMNQNTLPADRYSRAATVAGFMLKAASLTAKQAVQRYLQGERKSLLKGSMSSDEHVDLLIDCLCKMRGTALKFGQLLSLQYGILPERIRKALVAVRHRADVMPLEQVHQIMQKELGHNWKTLFREFKDQPLGSASLGQVHEAITADGTRVCVKVQFPGVAESIDSDIANLIFICTKTNLIPKSFFVNQFAREIKVELNSECNYENEANFYKIFRQLVLDGFNVPRVMEHLSTKRIITTEFVTGVPIEECKYLPQDIRDSIGDRLLRLSLSELFIFSLMNTDPNPSNYLYDEHTDIIGLIDFGSCRSYNQGFVEEYFRLVQASVNEDIEQINTLSKSLGFLNDHDTEEMVKHHAESVLITGQPFRHQGRFDFSACDIIQRCREKASIILKIRKQPPPPEVYSLHRKLAGCYVMCNLIGARVDARNIFIDIARAREAM